MKKNFLIVFLCFCLSFTMTACGEKDKSDNTNTNKNDTTENSTIISTKELLASNNFAISDVIQLDKTSNFEIVLDSKYNINDDEVVLDYLNNYLATQSVVTYNVLDKEIVEDNDAVNIDYTGYIDNEAFENGSATNYDLIIGSNTFIDGFENQIIGHKVGETFDIFVTFPENYNAEELKGKDAKFTVTLNAIEEPIESDTLITYDTMTDDDAKKYFGLDTKEEVVQSLTEYLDSTKDNMLYQAKQEALYELLLNESTFTYDKDLEETYIEHTIELQNNVITNLMELTLEDYLTTFENGISEEEYLSNVKTNAIDSFKLKLIIDSLIESNQYTITEKEFNDYMQSYISYYGYASVDDVYEKYASKDEMLLSFAESKYYDELISNLTVKYS